MTGERTHARACSCMLVHACARSREEGHYSFGCIAVENKLSTVNEGDNKVRDHESCFWLLSLRQEESPDVNRRHKLGVHRHPLPLMSAVTTTLTGADSKNYLAGLQPPCVPTVTDNCVQSS